MFTRIILNQSINLSIYLSLFCPRSGMYKASSTLSSLTVFQMTDNKATPHCSATACISTIKTHQTGTHMCTHIHCRDTNASADTQIQHPQWAHTSLTVTCKKQTWLYTPTHTHISQHVHLIVRSQHILIYGFASKVFFSLSQSSRKIVTTT